jgi:hypothetical protein
MAFRYRIFVCCVQSRTCPTEVYVDDIACYVATRLWYICIWCAKLAVCLCRNVMLDSTLWFLHPWRLPFPTSVQGLPWAGRGWKLYESACGRGIFENTIRRKFLANWNLVTLCEPGCLKLTTVCVRARALQGIVNVAKCLSNDDTERDYSQGRTILTSRELT